MRERLPESPPVLTGLAAATWSVYVYASEQVRIFNRPGKKTMTDEGRMVEESGESFTSLVATDVEVVARAITPHHVGRTVREVFFLQAAERHEVKREDVEPDWVRELNEKHGEDWPEKTLRQLGVRGRIE